MIRQFLCGLFLLIGANVWGWESASLLSVHTNVIGAFQANRTDSVSWHVAWAPWIDIGRGVKLRADLGYTAFKKLTGDYFSVANYEALLVFPFIRQMFAEAGAGYQTWFGNGGSNITYSLGLGYYFKKPVFGILNRFSVAYSKFFRTGNEVDIIKAGFGFFIF